jgi:hypothetical protein
MLAEGVRRILHRTPRTNRAPITPHEEHAQAILLDPEVSLLLKDAATALYDGNANLANVFYSEAATLAKGIWIKSLTGVVTQESRAFGANHVVVATTSYLNAGRIDDALQIATQALNKPEHALSDAHRDQLAIILETLGTPIPEETDPITE